MSRTAAKNKYRWKAVRNDLIEKGIRVLSASADESPGVYKDIHQVMAAQSDWLKSSPASILRSSKCAMTIAARKIETRTRRALASVIKRIDAWRSLAEAS